MDKKALSEVITGLLLILLIIAISGILFLFIREYNPEKNLSPALNCAYLSINLPVEIKTVCYNNSNQEVLLNLYRHTSQQKMDSINFNLNILNKNEAIFFIDEKCKTCKILSEGEEKEYHLKLNENEVPLKIKIIISNCLITEKNINLC